jgi:hypothetical protein
LYCCLFLLYRLINNLNSDCIIDFTVVAEPAIFRVAVESGV